MEIVLNLVWMLLAVSLMGLWLRHAPGKGVTRGMQIAALVMLILILYPIISISDDLQAVQNLAEDDIYLRRDFTGSSPHAVVPVVAMLPPLMQTELPVFYSLLHMSGNFPVPAVDYPALTSIDNRPPPTA